MSDLVKVTLIYLLRHLNNIQNGHIACKVKAVTVHVFKIYFPLLLASFRW